MPGQDGDWMNIDGTHEENMTPAQAAGYIVGVGVGFFRRHVRAFSILLALGGLGLVLIHSRLTFTSVSFTARIGDAAWIGVAMIAIGVALWFSFRRSKK